MPWHAKASGAYAETSQEAIDNMQAMADLLTARGWTLNAIAGVAGNIGHEGGYNPWRWQSDNIQPTSNSPWTNIGYGFFQFTPGGKYINAAMSYAGYGPNFSDRDGFVTDGQAQVLFVDEQADYYPRDAYPMTYAEYKVSLDTPEYLCEVWMHNYERPASYDTLPQRQASARFWYNTLTGGGGGGRRLFPVWLMKRRLL